MAPTTPNRPTTVPRGQQHPQATPSSSQPTLQEEIDLNMDTGDEEEGDIAPAHPATHEDEVAKLKRKIRELNQRHDKLLDAAKFNSEVAKNKIEDLEAKVANIANIAEGLGQQAERSQQLYREHIEHTAALTATGKDPGEILRPRQPDPYGGESDKLQGFLTSLRSYQMYYPTQFNTDELKVRHAMSFLKDKAQRVMEPILRDYVHNPPYARKQMTIYVYEKYEHFEKELTHAFGIADEKREAEAKIRQLVQKGSASTYLAEYRFQAAKLDWNEAAHMSQVYRGLKAEVKDAMVYAREKPKTLDELASLAVDIDNQLFERRKEKQAHKQGQTYTPNWNKNQQGHNRNHANQGRPRQADTSYGTQAGPMNVNATQTNRPAPTCWNCGKKGHRERDCRNPVKTNQKYRPVPEGRPARRTNSQEEEEPQMAVRTSKHVAMTRSGYDVELAGNLGERIRINQITEQEEQKWKDFDKEKDKQQKTAEKNKKYYSKPGNRERQSENRRQARQDPVFRDHENRLRRERRERNKKEQWTPVPENDSDATTEHTVAVTRKGKETIPSTESTLTPEEIRQKLDQFMDETFSNLPVPQADGTLKSLQEVMGRPEVIKQIDDIPVKTTRPNRHYRDPNYTSAVHAELERLGRRKNHKSKQSRYEDQWSDQTNKAVQRAKERAETVQDDDIYIRAITAEQEQNDETTVQRSMAYHDSRRYPSNEKHKQISWMSCTAHYCALHRQAKISNNCFPMSIPEHMRQKPYLIIDTVGYRLSEQILENEVMKFTAHMETRERALSHIQNRRSIDQWRYQVTDTPEEEPEALQIRDDECPDDALCYDSECDLRHPGQPGKDNSLLYR